MEYFTKLNLLRAQQAVISQYESEVQKIANCDSDGVLRSLLNVFSINNPLREKLCLLDAVSLPLSQLCSDTRALLIEKYLETNFSSMGTPEPNQTFRSLTLLVCKEHDRLFTYHVTGAKLLKDKTWQFLMLNDQVVKPFGNFGLFVKSFPTSRQLN